MNSHEQCIILKIKYSISLSWMEPIGIFMGTWIDLSKKKTNVNIMQK
jgi:hypothetical protein